MDAFSMPLVPKISEKSFLLSENNTYVFMVPITATKGTVKQAVEEQFSVTVTGVRISVNKGKKKTSVQKRKAPQDGYRKDTKRAYVTIKEGDNIPVFEEAK
jgi:large subunit ribosomal protein L23